MDAKYVRSISSYVSKRPLLGWSGDAKRSVDAADSWHACPACFCHLFFFGVGSERPLPRAGPEALESEAFTLQEALELEPFTDDAVLLTAAKSVLALVTSGVPTSSLTCSVATTAAVALGRVSSEPPCRCTDSLDLTSAPEVTERAALGGLFLWWYRLIMVFIHLAKLFIDRSLDWYV